MDKTTQPGAGGLNYPEEAAHAGPPTWGYGGKKDGKKGRDAWLGPAARNPAGRGAQHHLVGCAAKRQRCPAPQRGRASPAGTWWWRGGDGHHAGCLSVGFPTCGRFRGGQEDVLWLGSVSTSCLERQGEEAGHGSPRIRVPSEVPGEIGARLAQEHGAWGQKALNLGEFFQLKSIRDVKGLLKQPYFLNLIRQKKPGYSTLLIACRGGRAEAGAAAPRALAPPAPGCPAAPRCHRDAQRPPAPG